MLNLLQDPGDAHCSTSLSAPAGPQPQPVINTQRFSPQATGRSTATRTRKLVRCAVISRAHSPACSHQPSNGSSPSPARAPASRLGKQHQGPADRPSGRPAAAAATSRARPNRQRPALAAVASKARGNGRAVGTGSTHRQVIRGPPRAGAVAAAKVGAFQPCFRAWRALRFALGGGRVRYVGSGF